MKKKAIFSPGPSYSDPEVRKVAGWVRILDLYKEGLEELGYEVIVLKVDPKLIDGASTVSKILSYDVVAASQLPPDASLFLGPPGYSITQMHTLSKGVKKFLYVWNNQDWWRDQQLAREYKSLGRPYDLSPTWRWINRTALERCDHVIACSPWVKMTHSKIVPEGKVSINPWGVDSKKFFPPDVEPPGFNILFVGGDPIRKGLLYLAQALNGIGGVELWVAGTNFPFVGPDKILKVREFGVVPHEDIVHIMQQCHVICIPTLEDGVALAIQEGMACGLVPITSPETAEVFEDGVSGFKVDYRDVDSIREKILWLKDKDLLRLRSREARKKAESISWEDTKESFKEIIKRETTNG